MRFIAPGKGQVIKTSIDDSGPERYYSKSGIVSSAYMRRLELAAGMLGDSGFGNSLDIGCGSGIMMPTLEGACGNAVGIDLHDRLAEVKKRIGGSFVRGSVLELPFREAFDCVVCLSVLEHIGDLGQAVSMIKDVMQTEGIAIFGIPMDNLAVRAWFRLKKSPAVHTHINDEKEIERELSRAFTVLEKRYLRIGLIRIYALIKCRKG